MNIRQGSSCAINLRLQIRWLIAFIRDFGGIDRIIDHLKLTFIAEKAPPTHVFEQVMLMTAEERGEYF